MSTNCLVTKLKASIQNDDLVKIGEVIAYVISDNNKQINIGSDGTGEVIIYSPDQSITVAAGNGIQIDSNTIKLEALNQNLYTLFSVPSANSVVKLSILGKYSLRSFDWLYLDDNIKCADLTYTNVFSHLFNGGGDVNNIIGCVDFSKATNLKLIPKNGKTFTGNFGALISKCGNLLSQIYSYYAIISLDLSVFSAFSSNSNMNYIQIYGGSVSGSIVNLGNLIKLTDISILSNISGDIKDLADAQIAAGRTSGTLLCNCANGIVTYNGTVIDSAKTITFNNGSYTVS